MNSVKILQNNSKMKIKKCPDCKKYTLEKNCSECNKETKTTQYKHIKINCSKNREECFEKQEEI